jgi:hypothetical protein
MIIIGSVPNAGEFIGLDRISPNWPNGLPDWRRLTRTRRRPSKAFALDFEPYTPGPGGCAQPDRQSVTLTYVFLNLTRLTLVKLIIAGVIDIRTQLLNNVCSERPKEFMVFFTNVR